jgi:hypothetical protein
MKVDLVNLYAVPFNLQSDNNIVVLSRGNYLLDKIVSCKSCFVCFTKLQNLEALDDSKRRRCERKISIEESIIYSIKQEVYELKKNLIVGGKVDQTLRSQISTVEDLDVVAIAEWYFLVFNNYVVLDLSFSW